MRSLDIGSQQGATQIRARREPDTTALQHANRNSASPTGRGGDAGLSVETALLRAALEAPVEYDRVREIRDALREGTYPLNPAKIADAIIASRLLPGIAQ